MTTETNIFIRATADTCVVTITRSDTDEGATIIWDRASSVNIDGCVHDIFTRVTKIGQEIVGRGRPQVKRTNAWLPQMETLHEAAAEHAVQVLNQGVSYADKLGART